MEPAKGPSFFRNDPTTASTLFEPANWVFQISASISSRVTTRPLAWIRVSITAYSGQRRQGRHGHLLAGKERMGRVGNRVAIDPRQVYVTVQCYEARAGERGGEPLAGLKGDRAVLAPMYDQRLGADVRKHIPPISASQFVKGSSRVQPNRGSISVSPEDRGLRLQPEGKR